MAATARNRGGERVKERTVKAIPNLTMQGMLRALVAFLAARADVGGIDNGATAKVVGHLPRRAGVTDSGIALVLEGDSPSGAFAPASPAVPVLREDLCLDSTRPTFQLVHCTALASFSIQSFRRRLQESKGG